MTATHRRLAGGQGAAGSGRQVAVRPRKQRTDKFSYDARLILVKVWAACGGRRGRYLAVSMAVQLDALERHGQLCLDGGGRSDPQGRYRPLVRAELLSMSAATIDR